MKCPKCGKTIPNNSCKCLRCGYVCKSLVIESFTKEDENGNNKENVETKHIDPKNVKMGRQGNGGGLFDSLFGGLFGGGISDVFGGLFGDDEDDDSGYDDDPKYFDDFGNPMPHDVFDRDFVEIKKIEQVEVENNQQNANTETKDAKVDEDNSKQKGKADNAGNSGFWGKRFKNNKKNDKN